MQTQPQTQPQPHPVHPHPAPPPLIGAFPPPPQYSPHVAQHKSHPSSPVAVAPTAVGLGAAAPGLSSSHGAHAGTNTSPPQPLDFPMSAVPPATDANGQPLDSSSLAAQLALQHQTPIDQTKYKTKLCNNYPNGTCQFGNRCAFAHGPHELRIQSPTSADVPLPPQAQAQPPPSYMQFVQSNPSSPHHSQPPSPREGARSCDAPVIITSPTHGRGLMSPTSPGSSTPSRFRHDPYSPTSSQVPLGTE